MFLMTSNQLNMKKKYERYLMILEHFNLDKIRIELPENRQVQTLGSKAVLDKLILVIESM